jgi:hypothetical protein
MIAGDTSGGDIAPASPKCGCGLSDRARARGDPAASSEPLRSQVTRRANRRGRRDETRNGRYIEFRIVTPTLPAARNFCSDCG